MNNSMFPPSKKPRLDIQYGGSSQVPAGHEIQGTQAMDLGDDWDDDNLFIEAADEFDRLIALSQAVPTSNVIIHPTGQQNSEVKPFPTKLSTLNFAESPKSSKIISSSPANGPGSRFQKSKSFNLDQIASNFENKNNGVCPNGANVISETSIKQSEIYRTKCGENEILQKQIKNLTSNLHESKTKQRQMMLEKEKEKTLLKEEMNQKLQELKSELDRLNTELLFQKNHITSTEFRTKELKHARLKEPESPNSPSLGSAWRMVDDLNASFSRGGAGKTSPRSPGFKSPGRPVHMKGDPPVNRVVDHRLEEVECHLGSSLNSLVGDRLLRFKSGDEISYSSSIASRVWSDLVQLVTCQSFLTSKAKHLILNILSTCDRMLSSELSHLNELSQSEDKGESSKRDYLLSKSCLRVLPAGQVCDLLQAKKLFDSEDGSELRRCIKLIAVLCSLSSYALRVLLDLPACDLVRDHASVHNLEPTSTPSSGERETDPFAKTDILHFLKQLVAKISSQNRTKSYNGVLLSVAHFMLTIFHQKISLPENTLTLVSSIVKEIILSRPAPAVLEVCVLILAESTYSSHLQRFLCGQSDMSSCRTSLISNSDIVHSFTPQSCAIHVLVTYLELFHPTSSLIRAYLTWTLRLLSLGKTVSLRDSNSGPCDCTTEVFHGFLVLAWTSVRNLCKEFSSEQNLLRRHEIKTCVELAYQALHKLKHDKHLQFLQREGIYEALVLRLKTSNLNISLSDKLVRGPTLDRDSSRPSSSASVSPKLRNRNQPRTVICGDHLNEEFNDLDIC